MQNNQNCQKCRLQKWLCLCLEPFLKLPFNLDLLVHYREIHKASNTAKILSLGIENANLLRYGHRDDQSALHEFTDEGVRNLVLFPHASATNIGDLDLDHMGGIRLVVPDGSWRQASRIANRLSQIKGFEFIAIAGEYKSQYKLRSNPHLNKLCTYEATRLAIMQLLPKTDFTRLDDLFKKMVDRVLWMRGKIHREEVYGGLPLTYRQRKEYLN